MPLVQVLSGWTLVGKDLKPAKTDTKSFPPSKHKNNSQGGKPSKHARTQPAVIKLSATMWGRINYSCAYDALFTILYDIWQEHPSKWSEYYNAQTKYLGLLSSGFDKFRGRSASLEMARDAARKILTADFPNFSPIDHLAESMFGPNNFGAESFHCHICRPLPAPSLPRFTSHHALLPPPGPVVPQYPYFLSGWLFERMSLNQHTKIPPFLYFSMCGITHRYAIRGVVYLRDNHFTSRVIKSNGAVWYHDGVLTGNL
ncbi:hypothetical protein C8J57DRAFT_1216742 [Mycena rebaudengoi]|nr:hypothetical protein C8J57DRAFT_1216742 [Mycena rebaudengoi]